MEREKGSRDSLGRLRGIPASNSHILDWYDGVIKALLYFSDLNCWIYCFLIAIDKTGKRTIYGMSVLEGSRLDSFETLLATKNLNLNSMDLLEPDSYELIVSALNESAREDSEIMLVKAVDILKGFDSIESSVKVPPILDAEDIYCMDKDRVEDWFKMFDKKQN